MDSNEVKARMYELGADLCGIASIDRFGEAPKGFHPRDVLKTCNSVIVIAKRFLAGTLSCDTSIPYTIVRNILSDELDRMSVKFCAEMEKAGIVAIPTGTIGPTEFDKETGRDRNIVSAKHCAEQAGLGRIGKNTLLITPEFGNMVWLSVILTDQILTPDEIIEESFCENCNLCMKACPVHAVGEPEMQQALCSDYAFGNVDGKGDWRIKCYRCREVCPHCLGEKNKYIPKE